MSIDAMKQALDALEWNLPVIEDYGDHEQLGRQHRAITALRVAIEQAQEPVQELVCVCGAIWEGQELVSTPLPRQWQGLTDEEIWSDGSTMDLSEDGIRNFARAIEAKLKAKNT